MAINTTLSPDNRQVTITVPVKDSLHASRLADMLNISPYLKVYDRIFKEGVATIKAYTIPKLFNVEQLLNDLETMEPLMNLNDETK
jgi:hypothetical protein